MLTGVQLPGKIASPSPSFPSRRQSGRTLQRRTASAQVAPDIAPPVVHEALSLPGTPLDAATRMQMEKLPFERPVAPARSPTAESGGLPIVSTSDASEQSADRVAASHPASAAGERRADLSAVRVITGPKATESAAAVHAQAYTVGHQIVFDQNRYSPATTAGRELLAHELAHTLQQGASGRETLQKKDENEPPTSGAETVATVFPFAKDAKPRISEVFPNALFGFAPNHINTWVAGVQDQQLVVVESTADRLSAQFTSPVQRRAPGAGPATPIPNVRVTIERLGPGRFRITIASEASILATQEARAVRNAQGTIMLSPVAPKATPLPSSTKPASKADDYAKSDAAPLPGFEGPSAADKDKATFDSLTKPPAAEPVPPSPASKTGSAPAAEPSSGLSKEDEDTLSKLGENAANAFLKLPEGKRLTDAISKAAEKLPTVVMVVLPATIVAAASAGMVATKSESPIKTSPDIPLGKIGDVQMKAKVTFKGPANKPTEASMTLTFAKGSLEVAATFKRTWTDPGKPAADDNKTGTEAGLSVKIPLGKDAAEAPAQSDTDKTRAEVERLKEEEAAFQKGLKFKPDSPEAKAQAAEKKAIDQVAQQPFVPGQSTSATPRLLQSFDPRAGPGKSPWKLDQLSKLIGAGFAASPGATLHVVVFYASAAGDTDRGRATNEASHDTAADDAHTIRQALEQWLPITKGRIATSVEFKQGARTFGLSAADQTLLRARGAAVILVPKPGGA